MITVRVPAPPSAVPDLVVEPDGVEQCGADLLAASAQLDDLGGFVAGRARVADWTGDSAAAYRAAIVPLGRVADTMSLALRGVARRVTEHAEVMRALRNDGDELVRSGDVLARGVALLREDVARAGFDQSDALRTRADWLALAVADHDRECGAWVARVAAEERAMVAAFERVMTLEQAEGRYAGAPDPADAALAVKPAPGAPLDEVRAWWASLGPGERLAIVAAAPGAIGNLDGLPARWRHRANTVALDRDLAALRTRAGTGLITDDERRVLANAEAADDARHRIEERRDPVTDEPLPAQLYAYDPDAFGGDGAVAIAVGDLDRADHVAVIVPGMDTDATSAGSQADRAAAVYEAARASAPLASDATLAWIGYDAPAGFGEAATEQRAADGGAHLADTVDGLRAGRDGDPAHLTVIGYSYGSTTVGDGAHDHGLAVDDLLFVGSPGVGGDVEHAAELGIDPDHVWAGANSADPVAVLGNHGSFNLDTFGDAGLGDDPAEDDFGGTRFQAESTTRGDGDAIDDHEKYFDHGTESLANIGHVVAGDYDRVTEADPVTDPWWRGPVDPEADRHPTTVATLPYAS